MSISSELSSRYKRITRDAALFKLILVVKKESKKKCTYSNDLVHTSGNEGDSTVIGFTFFQVLWSNSDLGDPVGVTQQNVGTVTNGVPDSDGLISGSRDNLRRVGVNGNGQNVTGVADKSSFRVTGSQVPQSQGLIPRSGNSVVTVSRDNNILDDVRVTLVRSDWNTELLFVFSQLPGDQSLISGTGNQQVWLSSRGRQRGDPAVVAF